MRPSLTIGAFLTLLAVAACTDQPTAPSAIRPGSASAAKPVPSPLPFNVTTTVYDGDGVNQFLTRSDDFNGASSATYTAINRMSSAITASGAWQMYIGNQSVRTLYLVLGTQGIPGVPDGNYYANVEAFSQCFDANTVAVGIANMAAGDSRNNCSFGIDFTSGRTKYQLVMSPKYAGTGRAVVTCLAVASGMCSSWTIATDAAAPNATVANLYHFSNNGGLVLDGVYHNTFSVAAVR